MGRGSLAAGGSIYHADLIFATLELAGVEIPIGGRVLDFGCSSGRVIRVVKAYRRDLECHGCDPNEGAIRWANENLPDISFMVSPQRPPLASDGSSFECVFAISIWSHFGPEAATAWLAEMHRLLTPGGLLMLTTHSFGSVAYYASKRLRPVVDMRAVLTSMLGTGFGFLPMFGTKGDWGIIDPDWGEPPKGTDAELLGDVADILDEAITNIDDVVRRDEKNSLIHKALRKLATAANGYMNQLAMLKDKTQNEDELAVIERAFDNAKEIAAAGNKLPANEPEPPPTDKKKKKP